MFVHESIRLTAPTPLVEQRLMEHLRGTGLDFLAGEATEAGGSLITSAGPGRLTKRVVVDSLPAYLRGPVTVVPLRWTASGAFGAAFPTLDANIEVEATDDGTRITIIGSYRPPLGRVGAALDAAGLRSVAVATMRAFLTRLAHAVAEPADRPREAAACGEGDSAWGPVAGPELS